MVRKIFVWVKHPDEPPRHVWISDSLKSMQSIVGGYIECVTIEDGLVVICNEYGRITDLPDNVFELDGTRYEFAGTVIIAGTDEDEFDDAPECKITEVA